MCSTFRKSERIWFREENGCGYAVNKKRCGQWWVYMYHIFHLQNQVQFGRNSTLEWESIFFLEIPSAGSYQVQLRPVKKQKQKVQFNIMLSI